MERRSDKHGPLRDDALEHEVEGIVRSGHSTHAEEWKDPEPPGEDQPDVDVAPDGDHAPGTPPGMAQEDVELRTALAVHLPPSAWPADRDGLLATLADGHAPDRLVGLVRGLPAGEKYQTVQDVSRALGLHVEERRT
jgi:Protein of unknown function (DUF2795)